VTTTIRLILALALVAGTTQGCALQMASAVSTLVSGKSITDHVLSQVTGLDCSSWDWLTKSDEHSYYCEYWEYPERYGPSD